MQKKTFGVRCFFTNVRAFVGYEMFEYRQHLQVIDMLKYSI